MSQPSKYPVVLSVGEFREEFDIPQGIGLYRYDNGNLGWQAEVSDGSILRGPVSKYVVDNSGASDIALVKYYWDKDGQPLKESIWVMQNRPTPRQIEVSYSRFVLLCLINEKKKELWGEKWKPFTLKDLKFYLENCKGEDCYIDFSIPKRNGGNRNISAPNHGLKEIQSCLNLILQEKYHPTAAAMGFVPGRSVVNNAYVHQRQSYVYNIDIKDFFPSISEGRVFSMLQQKPYSFAKEVASMIADLCCHKGVLPQGAPTSPILTNIICERLDWRLTKLANQYDLKYSRYADDISFSGMVNVFHEDGDFVQKLKHYIEKEGFSINPAKTRLNTIGLRQEVTGLSVNEKPNVSKKYVKSLRTMIHNWEIIGREEAQNRMALEYKRSGKIMIKGIPQIENVIQGKLNYLKMVKGGSDTTYVKLNNRFQQLFNQAYGLRIVLDIWEKKGFDAAAAEYIRRFPWEQEYDTGVCSLSEFEEAIGKIVVFGSPKTETVLAGVLQKMGFVEELTPTIDGQPYLGKTKLVCAKDLDINKDVFVSYGDYKGKRSFFFSNKNGHLIGGALYDDEEVGSIIDEFQSGRYPSNVVEMIMKHKCVSPEERALRTKLILKEFDSVVEELKGQIGEMQGDTEKKNNLFGVSDFLYKFNQDGILRYTCHLLDKSDVIDEINEKCGTEKYDYEKHVNLIVENWEKLSKPYSGDEPTKNIRGLINAYIKGNKAWSSENIQTSWKSPAVIEWAKNHPGIILTPDPVHASKQGNRGYKLEKPFQSKFTGKRVAYFSELVLHFKTFFHIKGGNDLHKILERQDWSRKKGVEISFSTFEDNNEMFTDVDKLLQACELIIDMAVKASNEKQLGVPKIEFSLMEDSTDGLLALSIHHTNSVYGRGYSAMNRLGDSLNRLRKIMQGVCVIYIQADCGEGKYGELNLLDGNIPVAKEISQMTGVKYILKFKLKFQ